MPLTMSPEPQVPPAIAACLSALPQEKASAALVSIYATLWPPGTEATHEWSPDTVDRVSNVLCDLLDDSALAALHTALFPR